MRKAYQSVKQFLRSRTCRIFLAGLSGTGLLYSAAWGADTGSPAMPAETQHAFAVHFAPSFVFSPDEAYFPCDPFLIDGASFQGVPTEQDLAALRSRAADYRQLSLEEKMGRAALFYHAYRLDAASIVVEYWIYYLKNVYSARPLILPFRFGTSHPNDLEHVLLVLRPSAGEASADGRNDGPSDPYSYEVGQVLASAHNINNVFSFPIGRSAPDHLAVLVESGSHAMAPDVDGNERFEPKDDADRDRKMIWGIRDRGATLARYHMNHAIPRPPENSVALCHAVEEVDLLRAKGFQNVYTYQLVHQDYLDRRYSELEKASKDWPKSLSAGTGFLKRIFGEPQRGDQLLLPSRHENFGHPKEMIDRRVLRERGFTAGMTTMMERNVNLTLGGRWTWPLKGRWTPDLLWDSQLFITCDGNAYLSTEMMGYYPLDAMTNFFAGGGLIVNPADAGRRQWGFLGGLEFRLGRFRFHNAIRQVGPLYRHAFDFRIYYVF